MTIYVLKQDEPLEKETQFKSFHQKKREREKFTPNKLSVGGNIEILFLFWSEMQFTGSKI